jgi:hypothetical protein
MPATADDPAGSRAARGGGWPGPGTGYEPLIGGPPPRDAGVTRITFHNGPIAVSRHHYDPALRRGHEAAQLDQREILHRSQRYLDRSIRITPLITSCLTYLATRQGPAGVPAARPHCAGAGPGTFLFRKARWLTGSVHITGLVVDMCSFYLCGTLQSSYQQRPRRC